MTPKTSERHTAAPVAPRITPAVALRTLRGIMATFGIERVGLYPVGVGIEWEANITIGSTIFASLGNSPSEACANIVREHSAHIASL